MTRSRPADALSRFVRDLEATYSRQVAVHQAAGLCPEQAHLWALEDAKQRGRRALKGLRCRGPLPWSGTEPGVGGADVG